MTKAKKKSRPRTAPALDLAKIGVGDPDAGLVTYWANLSDLTSKDFAETRNPMWLAGYRHGVMDMMRRAAELPDGLLARVKVEAEQLKAAFVEERDRRQAVALAAVETPAQKSARTKRVQREQRDAVAAHEFADLIRNGHTTEMARARMNIGDVRARRIRKLAVQLGWLQPQQRTRHEALITPK